MNALLRRKKEWEFHNEQFLLMLVATSTDVSVESVRKAGLLTSFLMYLVYKLIGGMLAIAFAIFEGPRLVRLTAPEQLHENVEVNSYQLESKIKSPPFQR